MKRFVVMVAVCFSQIASAEGYGKYYVAVPGATPEVITSRRAAPPPAVPQLLTFSDTSDVVMTAFNKKGYATIGYSQFTTGWSAKDKGALKQGAKVGADIVVILSPQFSQSVTSVIPITTPTTQTTYLTGQATAYGSGGAVQVFGSGTATTMGTQTKNIPITVNRYEYAALYLVKLRTVLGAFFRDTTDDEKRTVQSNSGVVIETLMDAGPAFAGDVLPGDIVLNVNGVAVAGVDGMRKLVSDNAGKATDFLITRNGTEIHKSITLNPP